MEFNLTGKVKRIGDTFGIIKSNEYDEEHFFIKSDVVEGDRLKIKLGDTVNFELKTNKARGSNAFKIRLYNNESNNSFFVKQENDLKKHKQLSTLKDIFNNEKPFISVKSFQTFITENFFILNTDNEDLNDLIKLVVKDNIITDIEKDFLKEKTLELNLSINLLNRANNYLFSNNPFFDNILALIFKDGIIKKSEIAFLIEKSKENSFSPSFTNNRFWQYSFSLHINDLVKFEGIQKIIKLWYLSQNSKFNLALNRDWIILQLNILKSTNIEENIDRALDNFEKAIFPFLENKYNLIITEIEKIYQYIKLDIDEEPHEKLSKSDKITEKIYDKTNVKESVGLRQRAVINAVVDINESKVDNVCFPVDIKTFKNIVCGYYASKYFILNDRKPSDLASVITLYDEGLIFIKDEVDEKTVFDELKKNGYYAAANSYSKTHKYSTFNNDVFSFTLSKIGEKLNFNYKTTNETKILKNEKGVFFHKNKLYKKEDIYNKLDVPKEQQKRKWHNGYCEHNNEWFIFANVNQIGFGFSKNQEFDYNNSIDATGDLNWEAINNSKLSWESIQKLKSSTPFIFIRKPETKKHMWEYLGKGNCVYTLDTTPVKFKWKINNNEKSNTINKNIGKSKTNLKKTDNNDLNYAQLEELIWNKNIVPEKHKSRIITLINDDEIFDASQEYLNFAYENNQKDFSKIMDEFEKITKSLGK